MLCSWETERFANDLLRYRPFYNTAHAEYALYR